MAHSEINWEALQAPLGPADIEWRVQSSGKTNDGKPWARIIPYADARAIQARLDGVVGPENWRVRYERVEGGFLCCLAIRVGDEWIEKWDGADAHTHAGGDDQAPPIKSGISDALKRAATPWGINRSLYRLSSVFAETATERRDGWTYAKLGKGGGVYWWRVPEAVERRLAEIAGECGLDPEPEAPPAAPPQEPPQEREGKHAKGANGNGSDPLAGLDAMVQASTLSMDDVQTWCKSEYGKTPGQLSGPERAGLFGYIGKHRRKDKGGKR